MKLKTNGEHRNLSRILRPGRRALLIILLPAALLEAGGGTGMAAGVNPLPAVAQALSKVTSYQVVVTTNSTGTRPRPTGTRTRPTGTPPPGAGGGQRRGGGPGFFGGPGKQTRTIVAVRKGAAFEDYVVISGLDRSGKPATTSVLVYGNEICAQASGAHTYTCRTNSFQFSLDPTTAFAAGAGSTTFSRAGTKMLSGQSCDGYAYTNKSQFSLATGVVYISHATNLPCEQDSTITRHAQNGGGTFTQTTTVWSRFNDKSLKVPPMPAS